MELFDASKWNALPSLPIEQACRMPLQSASSGRFRPHSLVPLPFLSPLSLRVQPWVALAPFFRMMEAGDDWSGGCWREAELWVAPHLLFLMMGAGAAGAKRRSRLPLMMGAGAASAKQSSGSSGSDRSQGRTPSMTQRHTAPQAILATVLCLLSVPMLQALGSPNSHASKRSHLLTHVSVFRAFFVVSANAAGPQIS
eukprot:1026259-Pelagomonas_calceolata.AAC.1